MFDLNKLPVAPEFVETLQEDAVATLQAYLEKTKAPQEVLELARSVNDLGFYLTECYRDPKSLLKVEKADRFNVEELVITTVNSIAKVGGKFHGAATYSFPREGTPLAESKKG